MTNSTDDLVERLKATKISFALEAADRIKSLEAELSGVRAGTHAIVPVEPTQEMCAEGLLYWKDVGSWEGVTSLCRGQAESPAKLKAAPEWAINDWWLSMYGGYKRMIRAAQEAGNE
jgi:hypothetical protein